MKNRIVIMTLVLILLFVSVNENAYSESESDKTAVESFMEKYALAETLELGIQPMFKWSGSHNTTDFEWFNLTATHMMNRDSGLRLAFGYLAYDVLESGQNIGRLRSMTFRPTIFQNLATGAEINPYFGFGLNYYRTTDEIAALYGQKILVRTDVTWGAHLAMGFRYLSERSLSFSFDVYRDWMMDPFKVSRFQGRSELPGARIDLDMWALGLNIALRF
jgi:outer membrane protein W